MPLRIHPGRVLYVSLLGTVLLLLIAYLWL